MHYVKTREDYLHLHPWGVSCSREPRSAYGSHYMDIRKDYAFKRVFATEANKDLLTHFLNSLFEGKKKILDVEFRPTERIGEDEATKTANRIFYYGCRLVSGQVPAGKAGDNFDINAVYTIDLLDFMLWKGPPSLTDPSGRYLRTVDVSWTDTREPFRDAKWIFVQLPAFNKKLEELDSDLQRWVYLVNNLHLLKEQPASLNHPVFRKLFNINEIDKLNSEELQMYKLSFDDDRDWRNVISHARSEGEAIGEKRGEKRGEKQGKLISVQNLIRETTFDNRKIAAMAEVEESVVRRARAEMIRVSYERS